MGYENRYNRCSPRADKLKVALGTLKDKGDELATFLEPRVGAKPEVAGETLEIDDEGMKKEVKPRHVKTYIKRFLYMKGVRKNYRVLVSGRELTVQELELGEEKKEEEKEKIEKAEEREKEERDKPKEPEAKEAPKEPEKPKDKAEKPKKAAAKKKPKKKEEDEDKS